MVTETLPAASPQARELGDSQSPQKFCGATVRRAPPSPDSARPPTPAAQFDLSRLRVDLRAFVPSPRRVGYWPPLYRQLYATAAV